MSGCRCSDGALSQDWHTRQPSRVYCYAWWSQLSVSTIGHSTREPRPSHLSSSLILYSDGMMYRVVSNVVIFVVCHVHIPIFYPHVNMIFYPTILWPNYISLQSLSLSHSSTSLCPALSRFVISKLDYRNSVYWMFLDTSDIKCWQFISLRRTACLLLCTVVRFGSPRH